MQLAPQLLQMLMSSGLGQQLMSGLYQWGTGGNVFGFTPGSYDPTKTVGYNLYQQQEARRLSAFFGSAISNATQAGTNQYAQSFYRSLGYSEKDAAARVAEGSPAQSLILNSLIAPKISAAAGQIGQALYNQRNQWETNRWVFDDDKKDPDRKRRYLAAGSSLIESVTDSAIKGDFAGMGVADVGTLASAMINAGKFTVRPGEKIDTKVNGFKTELREYANAIHALQDVIEGPVEQIMDAFEQLTGSSVVSTSTGRVQTFANVTRSILSRGVVNQQQIAGMASAQYAMIAPFGGTQSAAANMALVTAAGLSQGIPVEGVSKDQVANTLMRMNARSLADGSQRAAAGAYAHYIRTHGGKNDDDTRTNFMAEIMKMGRNDFRAGISAYLNTKNVDSSEIYSARATNLMGDPELTAQLHLNKYNAFEKGIRARLQAGGFGSIDRVMSLVRNVSDPAKLESELIKLYGDSPEAARRGQAVADLVKQQARLITGEDNDYAAMAATGTLRNAARIVGERRMSSAWNTLGNSGNYKTGSGLQGMLQALGRGGALTLGNALGAAFGLDPQVMAEVLKKGGAQWGSSAHQQAVINELAGRTGMKAEEVTSYIGSIEKNRAIGLKVAQLEGTKSDRETVRARARLLNRLTKEVADKDGTKAVKAATEAIEEAQKNGLIVDSDTQAELLYRAQTGQLKEGSRAISQEEVASFSRLQNKYLNDEKYKGKPEKATQRAAAETQAQSYVKQLRAAARAENRFIEEDELKNDKVLQKYIDQTGLKGEDRDKFLKGLTQDNSVEGIAHNILTLLKGGIKVELKK